MAGNTWFSAAGIMRDVDATTIKLAIVDAAVALNWQSCSHPPINRQAPRHNKIFERTAPSILD